MAAKSLIIKLNPSWFIFFRFLLLGVVIVSRRDNWLVAWIGFELTLIGFLPIFRSNAVVNEGIIKYFLVQAGGSSLFLLSFFVTNDMARIVFLVRIILKLGLFPFYQWVPLVMRSLSWPGCYLLITFQKLGPLLMVVNIRWELTYVALLLGAIRVLVRGLLGFNQRKFRPLMAYSSVAHTGWLLCACVISLKILALYLLGYMYVSAILFNIFNTNYSGGIISSSKNLKRNYMVNTLLIGLAGIPPFTVFFLKVQLMAFLSLNPLVLGVIILGTVMAIYYYLTFIIPSMVNFWGLGYRREGGLPFNLVLSLTLYPLIIFI